MSTYYSTVASTVGGSAHANAEELKGQESVQRQLENLRGETSGVSMDEELTKMLAYQRAYQASARMISIADELFQTLLDIR